MNSDYHWTQKIFLNNPTGRDGMSVDFSSGVGVPVWNAVPGSVARKWSGMKPPMINPHSHDQKMRLVFMGTSFNPVLGYDSFFSSFSNERNPNIAPEYEGCPSDGQLVYAGLRALTS